VGQLAIVDLEDEEVIAEVAQGQDGEEPAEESTIERLPAEP